MTEAVLSGSNFADANLAGAKLARARLENVELRTANLKGADLNGAVLTGANALWKDVRLASFGPETLVGLTLHGEISGLPQTNLPGSFEVKKNLAAVLHRLKDE